MSRGFPSMTALLGLLAVAGFQNRDRIAELLRGGQSDARPEPEAAERRPGGSGAQGVGIGGVMLAGLAELVDRFRQSGQGEAVDSWVGSGANRELGPQELERAIGPDVMAELSERTGLPREELLERLSRDLPGAVDRYTPAGRLPTEAELDRS